MKTLSLIALLVLGLSATSVSFSHADGGNTSGGGERVGKILRDLVDKGTCVPRLGRTFTERNAPLLDGVLKDLEKTHWLFSWELRDEINNLRICAVSGQLKQLQTTDLDDFVYYTAQDKAETTMAAIRDGSTIYVDEMGFEKLESESKAYLFIHEAMHAFIPNNTERRNHKVRSIVRSIKAAVTEGMDATEFALAIEHSSVYAIKDLRAVAPVKDALAMLQDDRIGNDALMAAAAKVSNFDRARVLDWDNSRTLRKASMYNARLWLRFKQAVLNQNVGEVITCIRFGADLNREGFSENDLYALSVPVRTGNLELLRALLETPSPYYEVDLVPAAFHVAMRSNLSALQMLLRHPRANVSTGVPCTTDYSGGCIGYPSLVSMALDSGSIEAMKLVLAHPTFDAGLNHIDLLSGYPAGPAAAVVDSAIARSRADMVQELVKAGLKCERLCDRLKPMLSSDRRGH